MRGVTSVIVQTHQILRLPRKMNLMIDPCHTWNAIYNARSNKCHCPNSPNTAPSTKNESHDWSLLHMKRYLQCAEQQVSLSKLTKYCAWHAKWLSKILHKFLENRWNVNYNARPIRDHSEHETVTPQPASQPRLLFTPTTGILYWKIQRFALRLSFQISPNTAPATKSDTSTSPNTAPAMQNDSHDQSATHMKRYLQCAEQQASLPKLIKYCACHAKWLSKILHKFLENRWNVNYNARPIRDHSETIPSMKPSLRNPPRNRGYFSRPPQAFCIEKYNVSCSGYHSKFHQILRLPRKVTLQLHQILRLPRKMTLERHQIMHLPRKVTLERHQIVHLPRKQI